MTSVWAMLEMQAILRNMLRYATRILRPNISSQLSKWRKHVYRSGHTHAMFEERASVAADRKPCSQIMDERAYWNERLYGLKRKGEAQEENPRKRAAAIVLAALDAEG